MSYSYERTNRQRTRATYGASGRRTALGYWIPLAVTVSVATIGLAAWIWSERSDDDEDGDEEGREGYRPPPQYGDLGPGERAYAEDAGPIPPPGGLQPDDGSVYARMSGALRRTPSPQQIIDGASRRVAAGVAAAGAAVGGALSAIREESSSRGDFEDHSRWSEETETRVQGGIDLRSESGLGGAPPGLGEPSSRAPPPGSQTRPQQSARKRKSVAIVVSSELHQTNLGHDDDAYHHEHAVSVISP